MNNENIQTLIIKCNRCSHIWEYTGKSKYFATCSYCRNLVRINENTMVEEECTLQQLNQGVIDNAN
jgi:hypothetical protein